MCATIASYSQTSSIPNGNFEQWTSFTAEDPQNYSNTSNASNLFRYGLPFNVTKTTDAYHGTYAIQLTTNASATDTSFAYFINANPDKNPAQWTGGMPFNEKPTGIRGYYKYNVAVTDTATVMVAFSKAGVNIGTYMIPLAGIQNSYTLFNYTFSPALALTPDSVIFGAISCKLGSNGPVGPAGSTLKLDSVSFTGVSAQPALMNGDFEAWQSQTYNTPDNWYVQSDDGTGFSRTTDAQAGTYAVEIETTLGDENNTPVARSGYLLIGKYPDNCSTGCSQQGGNPFTNQIDTLAFYYKYAPSGNDTASILLSLKKNGSNIWGTAVDLTTAATYQYMEIPFDAGQAPDSMNLNIQSSIQTHAATSYVGSILTIDEIHFKSQPLNTSISDYANENELIVLPNPSNGKIQILGLSANAQSLEIYTMTGEKIAEFTNVKGQISNEIDLSGFPAGIYFVKVSDGETICSRTFVIQ